MRLTTEYVELADSLNDNIIEIINLSANHFDDNTMRQDTHDVHKGSKAVILKFNTRLGIDNIFPVYDDYHELLIPLMNKLSEIYGKYNIEKLMIAKLPPGVSTKRHQDSAFIMHQVHRIHWCLMTNDKVDFNIGVKRVPFEVGKLFDISNIGYNGHEVLNNGVTDRLHLIIDINVIR